MRRAVGCHSSYKLRHLCGKMKTVGSEGLYLRPSISSIPARDGKVISRSQQVNLKIISTLPEP